MPVPQTSRPTPQRKPQQGQRAFKAWENNFQYNKQNRDRQTRWLQDKVLNVKQKGVEVYRTK